MSSRNSYGRGHSGAGPSELKEYQSILAKYKGVKGARQLASKEYRNLHPLTSKARKAPRLTKSGVERATNFGKKLGPSKFAKLYREMLEKDFPGLKRTPLNEKLRQQSSVPRSAPDSKGRLNKTFAALVRDAVYAELHPGRSRKETLSGYGRY